VTEYLVPKPGEEKLIPAPAPVPTAALNKEPAIQARVRRSQKIFEQRRKWPNACLTCGGDGGLEGTDLELCPACFGQGKCPRCKAPLPENWKTLAEGLTRSIENETDPPPPVQCRACKWKDGNPPVLEI
jgi:hypothetical protein